MKLKQLLEMIKDLDENIDVKISEYDESGFYEDINLEKGNVNIHDNIIVFNQKRKGK